MLAIIPNFVSDEAAYSDNLKRALLLFDSIIIPDLERTHDRLGNRRDLRADLEFLAQDELVRPADATAYLSARRDPGARYHERQIASLSQEPPPFSVVKWEQTFARRWGEESAWAWEGYPTSAFERLAPTFERNVEHCVARALASELRSRGDWAMLVLDPTGSLPDTAETRKCLIMKVVMEKLEFPEADTPLQDILSFREEAATRRSLLAMRRWIRGLAEQSVGEREVQEEIEYLSEQHRRSIKRRRLRGCTSVIEAFFVVGADVVESLAKLRLKKLAELGVHIFKAADDMLESEAPTCGSEVSYLMRVRRQLVKR